MHTRKRPLFALLVVAMLAAATACGRTAIPDTHDAPNGTTHTDISTVATGTIMMVRDTVVNATREAAGVAESIQQATVSTKLMGTITEMRVREGDRVSAGQILAQLDARELVARRAQVAASIADAEAMARDATVHAGRIRTLFTEGAATQFQRDAVETGLARAIAAVSAARAAASEVEAMASYATVRAPFAGTVTVRHVDVGAFAAPGAPLVTVQDASTLRLVVTASGDAVQGLTRGQHLDGTIGSALVRATIEGVVPGGGANSFTVNATLENRDAKYRAGSAATLLLPDGERTTILVPVGALLRQGDLTGVTVRVGGRDQRQWVRTGATFGTMIEVSSGLRVGDQIVLPAPVVASQVR